MKSFDTEQTSSNCYKTAVDEKNLWDILEKLLLIAHDTMRTGL